MDKTEPGKGMPRQDELSRKLRFGQPRKIPVPGVTMTNQGCHLDWLLFALQNTEFPYMRLRTVLLALKTMQACLVIRLR